MSKDQSGKTPGTSLTTLPDPGVHGPALAAFEAYWRKMRRGALVPRRSDIDPRGIEPLLSHAFVTERIAPGLARLRIAGGHLTDLMGMEVRGMPISAFLEPGARDALAHHLVCLFDQPATLRLTLASAARPGAPALQGTLLMMPLRSDLGDISRALGCLVTTGTIGRGPRRFAITHAQVTPLSSAALPDAAPRLMPENEHPPAQIEPAQTEPVKHLPSERAYLRLVKS